MKPSFQWNNSENSMELQHHLNEIVFAYPAVTLLSRCCHRSTG
jgi:hypothetical protein